MQPEEEILTPESVGEVENVLVEDKELAKDLPPVEDEEIQVAEDE